MPAYQNVAVNPASMGAGGTMTAGGAGGDPSWLGTLNSLATLGGSIYGLVNSAGLSGDASTVLAQSNPFGQYRPAYGQQLMQLMQNPSSVTSQPGYQFLMDQGTQALTRSAYAPGGTGAGGQLSADLVKYGQGLADQFYNQQVSELAYLAGAGISPANPAQALQTKGGAATSLGSSIAGLTSGLGGAAGLISKIFGGSATPTGNAGSGLTPQQSADLSALFSGTYGSPNTAWDTGFSGVSSNLGYDPVTGSFSGTSTPDFSQFSLGSGYSPTTGSFYSGGLGSLNLSDLGEGSGDGGGIDLSGLFSNPKTAGGEAANLTQNPNAVSGGSGLNIGQMLGTGSQIAGIVGGIDKGTATSYAGAGINAAKLAANYPSLSGLSSDTASSLKAYTGAAGSALGIIQGLQTGGTTGDLQAAASAAQLAGTLSPTGLAGALGSAAGYVAAPLAIANFAKNWQSGATASDAMQGAEAGAAVGSVIPVVGTLVGAVAGAAIGALTSAFGPGAKDPETSTVEHLINWTSANNNSQAGALAVQNPYLMLQGLMDEHSSTLPIYQQFGRMNALGFTKAMTQQINSAVDSGQISKSDSPSTVFSEVVLPWVNSMGDWSKVGTTYQNVVSGLLQNMTAQFMSGQEVEDWTAVGGDMPFMSLTPFGGYTADMPITASSSPGHTGGVTRKY